MNAKSSKLVSEGHTTNNASNTTNSAYIDMDSFVTVQ
jgi:hypothetical protein